MLCFLPNWSLCRINQQSLFLKCSGTFPPRGQDWKLRSLVWEDFLCQLLRFARGLATFWGGEAPAWLRCDAHVCRVDDVPGDCVKARGQSQVRQLVPGAGPQWLTATSATPRCCVSHVDAEWKQKQRPSPHTSVRQPGSFLTQPNSGRSEAAFFPAAIDIVVTLVVNLKQGSKQKVLPLLCISDSQLI